MTSLAEPGDGTTVTVGTQTDDTEMNEVEVKPEELVQELLPGILNDITLELIVQKLPWNAFHTLSCASRSWLQAIELRLPYQARVRSNSTDILLLLADSSFTTMDDVLSLYSIQKGHFYPLPEIPHLPTPYSVCVSMDGKLPVPGSSVCVSMDGRIYLMGGQVRRDSGALTKVADVYVFDLAGQRQWKRCARMQEPRYLFGRDVLDGKIYVFGGIIAEGEYTSQCEMFDPIKDVWSSIPPMSTPRKDVRVAAFGEELFIYEDGCKLPEGWDGDERTEMQSGPFVEAYHSVKQTWTVLKRISKPRNRERGIVARFIADGKSYLVTLSGFHVNRDMWEELQSFSVCADLFSPLIDYSEDDRMETITFWTGDSGPSLNYEILAAGRYFLMAGTRVYLVQNQGVGSGSKDITWQILPWSLHMHGLSKIRTIIEL